MDRISLRGKLLNKSHVLDNPEQYRNRHVVIFELANDDYYDATKQFYKEWHKQMDRLILTLGFQSPSFEERARKLFFAMRDRLCETTGDTTRANKDAVYHGLILDCDFRTMDGRQIEHINELDKKQLWELIQRTERESNETEHTYEFKPLVNDIQRDYAK